MPAPVPVARHRTSGLAQLSANRRPPAGIVVAMTRPRRAASELPSISPLTAFLLLLRSPSRGVQTLRRRTVRPSAAAAFLVAVGALRGVLDIPWIYWQAGRLDALGPSLAAPAWMCRTSSSVLTI